jgi:hypothetical protein
MLNTGTFIGVSSNIYGGGFHKKNINSFSWTDASNNENIIYEFDKALSTAQITMKRRNVEMSHAYKNMLKYIFENRKTLI